VPRIGRTGNAKKAPTNSGFISEATVVQPDKPVQTSNSQIKPDFSCNLIRPQDMIMLKIDFVNMKLNPRRTYLRKINKKIQAYMIVHFPPQNIAEEAFYQADERIGFTQNPNDKSCDIDSLDITIPIGGNLIKLCLTNPEKGMNQELVPPVKARIGGPSRLVFRIPGDGLPFTIQDLLDWKRYELSVMSTALPPDSKISNRRSKKTKIKVRPKISEPLLTQTAIEAPYRLVISPSSHEGWTHSDSAVTFGDRTELWHTRLGVIVKDKLHNPRIDEGESTEKERIVRAIWSPDYSEKEPGKNDEEPFKMSLTPNDRYQLVRLTSDYNMKAEADTGKGKIKINPLPVKVNRLMLSPLGAWLDLMGDWSWKTFPYPLNISQWRHRGTQGRDHYVRVVYEGFLFPFGHRASLVKITERKFEDILVTGSVEPDLISTFSTTSAVSNQKLVQNIEASINYLSSILNIIKPLGDEKENSVLSSRIIKSSSKATIRPLTAIMRQRMFLIVKEPLKVYKPEGRLNKGRAWPFEKVRIKTLVTPNIDAPSDSGVVINTTNYGQSAFWPAVGGELYKFHLVAEDVNDNKIEMHMPLIFIDYPAVAQEAETSKGDTFRKKLKSAGPSKTAPFQDYLNGYSIKDRMTPYIFGQKLSLAQSDPNETSTTFETSRIHFGYEYVKDFAPCFLPTVQEADITLSSVKQILGEDTSASVIYSEVYLNNGFNSNNKGQVFLQLKNPLKVSFSKDLNKPGKADKSGGIVTPNLSITRISKAQGPVGGTDADFEKDAKFVPGNYFKDALDAKILGSISLLEVLDETPINFAEPNNSCPKYFTQKTEDGGYTTTLTWNTTAFRETDIFKKNGITSLDLSNTITKSPHSDKSSYEVYGVLQNFDINLLGLITIPFEKFEFHSWNGKKSDVDITIDTGRGLLFAGALQFINELKDFIPSNGFSDPPSLEVTQDGIKAGYSVGIPTIAMGIFSIQNISLSAGLMIPFTGEPVRVRFAFSEREHPFIVTVSLFGGGGFCGIAVGADGIEMFEAALEFGGNVSLDIGVASGGVYIMAGFYFKSSVSEGAVLEGYLRAGGELEILGLISISLEFYLGMKYLQDTNSVWGRATMTVEVEVAFFSKSVDLTVEREFARSSPPSFEDMISLHEWEEYCGAFA